MIIDPEYSGEVYLVSIARPAFWFIHMLVGVTSDE